MDDSGSEDTDGRQVPRGPRRKSSRTRGGAPQAGSAADLRSGTVGRGRGLARGLGTSSGEGDLAASRRSDDSREVGQHRTSDDAGLSDDVAQRSRSESEREHGTGGSPAAQPERNIAAEKAMALQAKNRRAQQRFRARQKEKVSVLQTKVDGLEEEMAELLIGSTQLDASQQAMDDGITVTAGSQPLHLSPAKILQTTCEEATVIWQHFVTALADLQKNLNSPAPSMRAATSERITQVQSEACIFMMRFSLYNPINSRQWMASNMEEPAGAHMHEESGSWHDRWRDVANVLQLSPRQKAFITRLRQVHQQSMGQILHDRGLARMLVNTAMPRHIGMHHTSICHLQAHEAIQQLRSSLWQEHILLLDFMSHIYREVFRPEQVALCFVHSYPYVPDVMAMSCWIAHANGDPHALDLLLPHAGHHAGMHSPPLSPVSTEGYERVPEASSGFSHETLSPLRALTVHGHGGTVAGQQHSNPSSPGIPTPASSVSPVLSHAGMENPFADKAHLPLPARSRSPMSGLTDYTSATMRRRSGTPPSAPAHRQGLALQQSSLSAHGSGTPFLRQDDMPSISAPPQGGQAEAAFMLASLEAMAPLPAGGLETRHMHGAGLQSGDVDMSGHMSGYVSDGQALPLGNDPFGAVGPMFGAHAQLPPLQHPPDLGLPPIGSQFDRHRLGSALELTGAHSMPPSFRDRQGTSESARMPPLPPGFRGLQPPLGPDDMRHLHEAFGKEEGALLFAATHKLNTSTSPQVEEPTLQG
ncbi:hypothetical protein WJX73_004087 [Symbiochloris irregularis]|uniref:BZIP domain-containing protein n=1 Tax=Symbiochloris irregularis TaxID=706552 RepID=A0AAW1P6R6_9CHLO